MVLKSGSIVNSITKVSAFLMFLFSGLVARAEDLPSDLNKIMSMNDHLIGSSRQVVVVLASKPSPHSAVMYALEKSKGRWTIRWNKVDVVIGRNGFADFEQKREGDGRTPCGVFELGMAFGYNPKCDTGLAYRQATKNDFWVDDVKSPQYNLWVTGKPNASSFERLRRKDHLYKYGIVVEYNTHPIVKGHGSAIFLHVWRSKKKGTAGCVAMSETHIVDLLKWLNRDQQPKILMGKKTFFLSKKK